MTSTEIFEWHWQLRRNVKITFSDNSNCSRFAFLVLLFSTYNKSYIIPCITPTIYYYCWIQSVLIVTSTRCDTTSWFANTLTMSRIQRRQWFTCALISLQTPPIINILTLKSRDSLETTLKSGITKFASIFSPGRICSLRVIHAR